MSDIYNEPEIDIGCVPSCPLMAYRELKKELAAAIDHADKTVKKLIPLEKGIGFASRMVSDIYAMGYANKTGSFPDSQTGGNASNLKGKLNFDHHDVLEKLYGGTALISTPSIPYGPGAPLPTIQFDYKTLSDTLLFKQMNAIAAVYSSLTQKVDSILKKMWNMYSDVELHVMGTDCHNEDDGRGFTHVHYFAAYGLSLFDETVTGATFVAEYFTDPENNHPAYNELMKHIKANGGGASAMQEQIGCLLYGCANKRSEEQKLKAVASRTPYDPLQDEVIKSYIKHVENVMQTGGATDFILKHADAITKLAIGIIKSEKNAAKASETFKLVSVPQGLKTSNNAFLAFCYLIASAVATYQLYKDYTNNHNQDFWKNIGKLASALALASKGVVDIYIDSLNARSKLVMQEAFPISKLETASGLPAFADDIEIMEHSASITRRAQSLKVGMEGMASIIALYSLAQAVYDFQKERYQNDLDQYYLKLFAVGVAGIGAVGTMYTFTGACLSMAGWQYASAATLFTGVGAVISMGAAIAGLALMFAVWYYTDHPLIEWIEDLPWGDAGYTTFGSVPQEQIEGQLIYMYYDKNNTSMFFGRVYDAFYAALGYSIALYLNYRCPGVEDLEVKLGNKDQQVFYIVLNINGPENGQKIDVNDTRVVEKRLNGAWGVKNLYEALVKSYPSIKRDGKTKYVLMVTCNTPVGTTLSRIMDDVIFSDPAVVVGFTYDVFDIKKKLPADCIIEKNNNAYFVYDKVKNGFTLCPRIRDAKGCKLITYLRIRGLIWDDLIGIGVVDIDQNGTIDVDVPVQFMANIDPLDGSDWQSLGIDFELKRGDDIVGKLEDYQLMNGKSQYIATLSYVNSL